MKRAFKVKFKKISLFYKCCPLILKKLTSENVADTTLKVFLVVYLLDKKIHITFVETEFQIPRLNTVWNGSNSIRYFGPVIWDLVLSELKYTRLLKNFKTGICQWIPKNVL